MRLQTSFQEDEMRAKYGWWAVWRPAARLRGLLLWARVCWMEWRGKGGTIRLKPRLYIWPNWRRPNYGNLYLTPEPPEDAP